MFEGYGHRESLFERNRKKMSLCSLDGSVWKNELNISKRLQFSNGSRCLIPRKNATPCPNAKNVRFYTRHYRKLSRKKLELSKDIATTVSTAINGKDESHATREILADLQPLFEQQYGHSFTDAVTRLPGSQLQAKPTKKRVKRKIQ